MRLFGLPIGGEGPWAALGLVLLAVVFVALYFGAFFVLSSRPANLLYQRCFALIRRVGRHVA
jgi:hypothetical protein